MNHGVWTSETGWRLSASHLPPIQKICNWTGTEPPSFTDDMWMPPVIWLGLIVLIVMMVFWRTEILTGAIDKSVAASYAIAKNAVLKHKPDVIVGFSWGGGCAARLPPSRAARYCRSLRLFRICRANACAGGDASARGCLNSGWCGVCCCCGGCCSTCCERRFGRVPR